MKTAIARQQLYNSQIGLICFYDDSFVVGADLFTGGVVKTKVYVTFRR